VSIPHLSLKAHFFTFSASNSKLFILFYKNSVKLYLEKNMGRIISIHSSLLNFNEKNSPSGI